ncbi:N-acetylneuraminate synthase family protein [Sphingobacterium sp. NGMCC 1.201703]|uniref:N-acetylneuraminate synthase family protein n=1 Tax=Sphingobacterium sp. NGMCC 1.201703 TaxID=3388657 RepID=UPI0039FC9FDD
MFKLEKNYYIAETAFHHEGDVTFLKELVGHLLKLDIQAIKFHLLFDVDDYMVKGHSAIDVIRRISISEKNWEDIFEQVLEGGKDIVALTNDVSSLKYINSIQNERNIAAIELHSTGLNDLFLLQEACNFKKTVILGIGGSTFDEIQFAVDYLKNNGKSDILLMHGFQNYPTSYEDINFSRINLMREAFNLPIGYADHTDPLDDLNAIVSTFPLSYGVRVFEKHVTHVYGEKRIDAQAAVSIKKMEEIIALGNSLLKTIGESTLQFSIAELNYGNTGPMKKALVARHKINKGKHIRLEDLAYKRTEISSMIRQNDIFKIIDGVAKRDIEVDELITYDNVEYQFKSANFDQFFINKD